MPPADFPVESFKRVTARNLTAVQFLKCVELTGPQKKHAHCAAKEALLNKEAEENLKRRFRLIYFFAISGKLKAADSEKR